MGLIMHDERNNATRSDPAKGSERLLADSPLAMPDAVLFHRALKKSLWQQLPAFVVCALLLDGGRVFRVCLIAMLGFWLIALLVLARNAPRCDRLELLFFRWGFFPLFAVIILLNNAFHSQSRAHLGKQPVGTGWTEPNRHSNWLEGPALIRKRV
jgi:hypothetical protein